MRRILVKDGEVEMSSILGVFLRDVGESSFAIDLFCMDGVHTFAQYPTREKAEKYLWDLEYKIRYSRKGLDLPPNVMLV